MQPFWPDRPNPLKAEMIIGPKRPKRELTFARLSAIEIKERVFWSCGAPARRPSRVHGRAPGGFEIGPWRDRGPAWYAADRAGRPRAGAGHSPWHRTGAAPSGFVLGRPVHLRSRHGHRGGRIAVETTFRAAAERLTRASFATSPMSNMRRFGQRPGTAIWAAENVGFAIEPLHRGFIFSAPMEINLVADAKARRIIYDPVHIRLRQTRCPRQCWRYRFFRFPGARARWRRCFRKSPFFKGRAFSVPWRRGQNSRHHGTGDVDQRPPIRAARSFRRSAPSGSNVRRWPPARSSFTRSSVRKA